ESVDELVGKGKLSEKEGKKLLDDFFDNTNAKRGEFEEKMREAVESVVERFSVPSKAEYDALKQRVEELEAKLAEAQTEKPAARRGRPPGSKTTAKKTPAKKTTRRKAPPAEEPPKEE
ncbi:MAG: hypothetical protein D6722_17315, partial [Bacteroidetes bacterium]